MTSEKQKEIYESLHKELMEISNKKSHDYAGEDVLKNFKMVSGAARELGLKVDNPTQYALFMVLLKIARLSNLLNANKTPSNESLEDSFKDGILYMKLAYCNYIDEWIPSEKSPLIDMNTEILKDLPTGWISPRSSVMDIETEK